MYKPPSDQSPENHSEMASKTTFITIFILSSFMSFASTITVEKLQARPFKTIFAFGDSLTETGNTNSGSGPTMFHHVSSLPYGTSFFHHSTNRYSDGRLVIDFVAEALSLPYLPPYLHRRRNNNTFGVNFAVAGATAINHEFFVRNNLTLDGTPQSIQTQLLWFERYLESHGYSKADFEDTLFWFGEIGINDYAYTLGSPVSPDTIRKLAIYSVSEVLETLLEKGAKYVVVEGLPLSGCLPLTVYLTLEKERDDLGCVKSVNNHSDIHNLVLQAKLQQLRKQYPHAVIVYADFLNAYRTVLKNPSKYGFTEKFKVCCGYDEPPYNFNVFYTCGSPNSSVCTAPSRYINWDGVHLTQAMNKVVSDMFLHGNFSHPTFSFLLDKKQRHG